MPRRTADWSVARLLAADRMAALHLFRLVLGLAAAVAVTMFPRATGDSAERVVPLVAAALMISTGAELWRRLVGWRPQTVITALLVADAVWLAIVRSQTGGPASLLAGLAALHVVGVTLLASARTGLRISLVHAGLWMGSYAVSLTGAPGPSEVVLRLDATQSAALGAAGFLLLAAATAALSAVNERELRRGRADMALLAGVAADLDRVRRPDDIASVALRHAVEHLGFRRAAMIVAWDGTARRYSSEHDAAVEVVAGDDEIMRKVTGDAVLVRDLQGGSPELSAILPGARNLVVVPVSVDGRSVGALALEHGRGSSARIARHEVDLARQFASHVGLAMHAAWLHLEVERLASEDQLTGLANRRVFEETLERELRRGARTGRPVSLVMIDADHFKQVNDVHGHQVGDEVLRGLGRILAEATRAMDTACRYGGEELVLILPDADAAEALDAAERVRRSVERDPAMPVPVTVSVGVATFPAHGIDGPTLLAQADAALYASKEHGRNRVTAAGLSDHPSRTA